MPLSPQEELELKLLEEVQRKKLVRKSLAAFSRECGYEPARHHNLLISALEAAVRREKRRIIFTLPPNSAKSTYSSVLFAAWAATQLKKGEKILACSHNFELVAGFGRKARNLVNEKATVLGYGIQPDSKASDNWTTTNGVEYKAAGCGAGISGIRAAIGLIDDPIGKKEDADSELFRNKLWDWYQWEFLTRLDPNGSIIIIQTRWHEDDLAGRLIAKEGLVENGGEWTLINIPLIANENDLLGRLPGEMLWAERFNEQHLKDAMKDARAFSCLQQGDPEPVEGNHFKAEWLQEYDRDQLPADLRIYGASDHAVSTKQTNDRSCLGPFGICAKGNIYILPDLCWDRIDSLAQVNYLISTFKRRAPLTWWAENENIKKAIGPFLSERMLAQQVFCNVENIAPAKDKMTRSQAIHARMSMKTVFFPRFATWWPAARKELLAFPAGKHDDFVDFLSLIGLGLMRLVRPTVKVEEKTTQTLTLGWVKESHKHNEREKRLLALDR